MATALRRTFAEGYRLSDLRVDALAGLVVGIVALPLSMALAIAVGAAPQHGLYTAIFAGALVAIFGGCRFQVTGPTAAFVVILAPIVTKYGLSGLLTAGFMAGLILIAMGAARLGRLIQYIPHPVTTGFTTGIATVIATLQIKDALGLQVGSMPEHFTDKVAAMWSARSTIQPAEIGVAGTTLALLLLIPRWTKKIPAPLLAISFVAAAVALAQVVFPWLHVATIGTRFHTVVDGVEVTGIPPVLPVPAFPWRGDLSFGLMRELFPAAFAIALLGAIESLLSGVIADGMTGTRHDPDAELVGLGIGNIVAPFFGGIAATGALARTATNVRAGARSPFASVIHAVVVLVSMVALARLVAFVPMASLAALLLLVAWNMSEVRSFVRVVRVAPKSDVFVLLVCYGLTVLFDMVVAVTLGVLTAAILFMRRMAEMTQSRALLDSYAEESGVRLPKGVALYEIHGPLFFGAAQNAMGAMHAIRGDTFAVMILNLGKVSVIDSTGLVALENAIARLVGVHKHVVLAGPLPEPSTIWSKANLRERYKGVHVAPTLEAAMALAEEIAGGPPSSSASRTLAAEAP
ncbi:MAG: C4-dicarboxylic acid transporter DauA [Polyangiaceae bacterium]|nr:C4-dicarboxylic acid transporter DauA [Polyangiaceae bacterium]